MQVLRHGRLTDLNVYSYGWEMTPGQTSENVAPIRHDHNVDPVTDLSMIFPAVIEEDGGVNQNLDPTDLTKRKAGGDSTLTGENGDVMCKYENIYVREKLDTVKNKFEVLFSRYPLPGFTLYPAHAVGIYPGYIDDVSGKLRSISGVIPTTDKNLSEFRDAANLKTAHPGWSQEPYWMYKLKYHLFVLENLNLNSQSVLGEGATNANSTNWTNYNGYNPVWTTDGGSAATGGGTVTATPADPNAADLRDGQITITVTGFSGGDLTTNMAVLHWQRDVFGHIWQWLDGGLVHYSTASGARLFISKDKADFGDADFGEYITNIAQASGYVSKFANGSILPELVAGASSEHCGDYHYTSSNQNVGFRGLLVGGALHIAADGGLAYFHCNYAPSSRYASVGSRLFLQY
jgi:hypothetical protein